MCWWVSRLQRMRWTALCWNTVQRTISLRLLSATSVWTCLMLRYKTPPIMHSFKQFDGKQLCCLQFPFKFLVFDSPSHSLPSRSMRKCFQPFQIHVNANWWRWVWLSAQIYTNHFYILPCWRWVSRLTFHAIIIIKVHTIQIVIVAV